MKQLFLFTLLFIAFNVFSQDISKTLQSGKWFASADKKGVITYSKRTKEKDTPSYQFKEDGKVIHCAITTESSLDKNGKETMTSGMRCDSVWHYEVKNSILKMQLLKQTPDYYKVAIKGDNMELTSVKPEDFR